MKKKILKFSYCAKNLLNIQNKKKIEFFISHEKIIVKILFFLIIF